MFRCISGILAALAIGVLAASLQLRGWAPLGLLPILAGVALGGAISVLNPGQRVTRTRLIVVVLVLSLLAIVAEHAWLYRDFRRQWQEARAENAQLTLFRPDNPWSPAEYFANELSTGRAVLWCADALLIAGSAVATVLVLWRPPPFPEY